ncbi:MAG: shikimate kinase [Rhodoluna sp.]
MPDQHRAIVLIGPMGVGKTTVGKKLARALNLPFTDTDALVVEEHGSIEKIFADLGEAKFREFELIALQKACANSGVVATGGGAVLSAEAQKVIENCTVIYLSTDGRHITSRLSHGNRPLLKNGVEDWKRIYESRKPIYSSIADYEINTSTQPLAATISEIRERLGI